MRPSPSRGWAAGRALPARSAAATTRSAIASSATLAAEDIDCRLRLRVAGVTVLGVADHDRRRAARGSSRRGAAPTLSGLTPGDAGAAGRGGRCGAARQPLSRLHAADLRARRLRAASRACSISTSRAGRTIRCSQFCTHVIASADALRATADETTISAPRLKQLGERFNRGFLAVTDGAERRRRGSTAANVRHMAGVPIRGHRYAGAGDVFHGAFALAAARGRRCVEAHALRGGGGRHQMHALRRADGRADASRGRCRFCASGGADGRLGEIGDRAPSCPPRTCRATLENGIFFYIKAECRANKNKHSTSTDLVG